MEYYHDFSALGLSVPQRKGIYAVNQAAKSPIIAGYLMFSLGKLKTKQAGPTAVAELFCADAYYSFFARRFGADHCLAIDNDRDGHMAEARAIKKMLGDDSAVEILNGDVFDLPETVSANIVLNCGGLYHVTDPLRALDISYRMATDYLIVQSVVSLATEDRGYFETPAPGWTWGSRFSYHFLADAIAARGWNVIDADRNELTGNHRMEDRGSAYFLISK